MCMEIKNRIIPLVFRLILLIGCGIGLYLNSGLPNGALNLGMLNFYTILSNLVCFVFFAYMLARVIADIKRSGITGVSTAPRFKGAITMMITVTLLIYHFMLMPQLFTMSSAYSAFSPADVLVHYFTPIMTILDWLLFDEKNKYRWYDPILWLILPLTYFVFAVIRAQVGGVLPAIGSRYPYFFMDIDALGLPAVLLNVLVLVLAFLLLGYVIYLINKLHFINKKLYFGNHALGRSNI